MVRRCSDAMITISAAVALLAVFAVKAASGFGFEENDSGSGKTRSKRSQTGKEIQATLKTLQKTDLSKFGGAFGINNVEMMKVVGLDATDACATCRVRAEGKDFALKVCDHVSGFGQHEKQALMDLSPGKRKELTFVPEVIEKFSKDSVTYEQHTYTTLATTLAGPHFKKMYDVQNVMSLASAKQFLGELEKYVSLLHAKWCHNDLRLVNIAVNAETGKQDQFFILNYGIATKVTPECESKDFRMFGNIVAATLTNLPIGTLSQSDRAAEKSMFQSLDAGDIGKFREELRNWAGEQKVANRPPLFENWAPGKERSVPKFDPVNPFTVA